MSTEPKDATCYVEDGFLTHRDADEEVLKSVRLSDIVSIKRSDYLADPYRMSVPRKVITQTSVCCSNGGADFYPIDATDLHHHLVKYRNS